MNKKIFNKILVILAVLTINALAFANISSGNITYAVYRSRAVRTGAEVLTDYWVKPEVKVISPNGGEEYEVNEEITIKWEAHSSDPGSSITSDLYFSEDAGAHYALIASNLEDTFTYDWTLPSVKSDQMKIKVMVEDEHSLTSSDESDAVFDPVVKDDESKKDSNEVKDENKDKDDEGGDPTTVIPAETPAPNIEPTAEVISIPEPIIDPIQEPVTESTIPLVEEDVTPASEPTVEPSEPISEDQKVVEEASSDPAPEPESSQETSPAPDEEAQDAAQ